MLYLRVLTYIPNLTYIRGIMHLLGEEWSLWRHLLSSPVLESRPGIVVQILSHCSLGGTWGYALVTSSQVMLMLPAPHLLPTIISAVRAQGIDSREAEGPIHGPLKCVSTLNSRWKDGCWNWSSNTLATWCEEPAHWKRPWCWERLRAGGKGLTEGETVGWQHQWTWVWANSGR